MFSQTFDAFAWFLVDDTCFQGWFVFLLFAQPVFQWDDPSNELNRVSFGWTDVVLGDPWSTNLSILYWISSSRLMEDFHLKQYLGSETLQLPGASEIDEHAKQSHPWQSFDEENRMDVTLLKRLKHCNEAVLNLIHSLDQWVHLQGWFNLDRGWWCLTKP